MKLHAAVPGEFHLFTAYGDGYVSVNGRRYEGSLLVTRDSLLPWTAASFDALTPEHFAPVAELGVEIVLLGTGPQLRFPAPALTAVLARAGIGLEIMDLQAACRTYNILVAEERKVAAALVHV